MMHNATPHHNILTLMWPQFSHVPTCVDFVFARSNTITVSVYCALITAINTLSLPTDVCISGARRVQWVADECIFIYGSAELIPPLFQGGLWGVTFWPFWPGGNGCSVAFGCFLVKFGCFSVCGGNEFPGA